MRSMSRWTIQAENWVRFNTGACLFIAWLGLGLGSHALAHYALQEQQLNMYLI